MHHEVIVIAHHRVGVNATSEDLAYFQNASLYPGLAVLKALSRVVVKAAKPSSTHTPGNAVIACGMGGINEGFARLSHGGSVPSAKVGRPRISLSVA